MTDTYTWRAVNRSGNARTGQADWTPEQMSQTVQRWFRTGWRWAEIRLGGNLVGEIGRNLDTGTRIWWAEVQDTHAWDVYARDLTGAVLHIERGVDEFTSQTAIAQCRADPFNQGAWRVPAGSAP